jgi:hypothetical protein
MFYNKEAVTKDSLFLSFHIFSALQANFFGEVFRCFYFIRDVSHNKIVLARLCDFHLFKLFLWPSIKILPAFVVRRSAVSF